MHWPLSLPLCPAATLPPWVSWRVLVPLPPGLCTGCSCCLEGPLHLSPLQYVLQLSAQKPHRSGPVLHTLVGPGPFLWSSHQFLAVIITPLPPPLDYMLLDRVCVCFATQIPTTPAQHPAHSECWLNTLPQGRRKCDHLGFKLWAQKLVPLVPEELDMGTEVTLHKKMFVCPHAFNKCVYIWLYFVLNSIKSTPFYQEN